MKSNYAYSATIIIIIIVAVVSLNNSGGPNVARSGSPHESGATCVTCHGSFALNSGTGSVSISGITSYIPGNTYDLTVAVAQASPKPISFGFQGLVLAASDNSIAGTMTITDTGTKLKTIAGRNYLEHNTPGDSGVWTFQWTAPPTNVGDVKFYFSGNASNSNGGTSGDYIYNSVTTVPPDSLTYMAEIFTAGDVQIYPNPNDGKFNVRMSEFENLKMSKIEIYNIGGELVFQSHQPHSQSISTDLPNGIYFIQIQVGDKIERLKMVKM